MSSNLKVNTILPSTGSNVAIGTAGGTVTMVGNVDIDINSGISTFNDIHVSDKIVHDGDTNTSLRFPAADTITAETSGSERLRITSDGNIGINVTPTNYSNYVTLALNDTTGSTIEGRVGGTLTGSFSVDSLVTINAVTSIPMVFKTANTERLRIESGGDVDLKSGVLKLGSGANRRLMYRSGNNDVILEADSGDFYRQDIANSTHQFYTGNNERLRITSAGYFKLGSTDGGAWHTIRLNTTTNNAIKDVLNIHSSVDSATAAAGFGVRLNFYGEQLNGNEYIYGGIAGLLSSTGSNYGDLAFYTNNNGTNTERLRITSAGKVGINTSSPTNVFTIHHNDNNQFAIKSGDTNADIVLADSGGSSRLRHSNSQFEVWTGGVAGSYYAQNSVRRLAVTSSGYLQKLNNPSFRAGLSANTTFNQSTDIIFNDTGSTWHYNLGNHYNTSNGRFTAPVSGVYQFNACVIWLSLIHISEPTRPY